MKPSYEAVEKKRISILRQAFADRRASLGSPYYNVSMFHDYIEHVYQTGFNDGKEARPTGQTKEGEV